MLRLLGKGTSINVRKVTWACAELDVPFEREDWGGEFRDTGTEEFLALNPNATVPVIVDGDFVLWESNAIVRYLMTAYGGWHLYPDEAKACALVDQWMDWQASEFNPSWGYAFHALVRKNPAFNDPAAVAASLEKWSANVGILDAHLAKSDGYVAGSHFTAADIPIALSVNRWFMSPIPARPDYPAVSAYYDRLEKRPAFREHGRNGVP